MALSARLVLAAGLAGCSSGDLRRKAEQPAGEAAVALKGGGPLDYLGAEVEDALVHLRVYVQGEAAGPANQSHRP